MKRKHLIVLAAIIASLFFVVACEQNKEHKPIKVKVSYEKIKKLIDSTPPDEPPKFLTLECKPVNGDVYCDPWE